MYLLRNRFCLMNHQQLRGTGVQHPDEMDLQNNYTENAAPFLRSHIIGNRQRTRDNGDRHCSVLNAKLNIVQDSLGAQIVTLSS